MLKDCTVLSVKEVPVPSSNTIHEKRPEFMFVVLFKGNASILVTRTSSSLKYLSCLFCRRVYIVVLLYLLSLRRQLVIVIDCVFDAFNVTWLSETKVKLILNFHLCHQ